MPSEAGIIELYFLDDRKKLNLIFLTRVWYGGLRSRLRRITDPELVTDERLRTILTGRECYFRYSIMRSFDDMKDVLFFYAGRYHPGDTKIEDSGRYFDIYLEERSPDRIVTI